MDFICLVLVVLLSHHSLDLVPFSPQFLPLVAYRNSLFNRYNPYFYSNIEEPVLYTVNYNTWKRGCQGNRREWWLYKYNITQENIHHNTTVANYSHLYGVYVFLLYKQNIIEHQKTQKHFPLLLLSSLWFISNWWYMDQLVEVTIWHHHLHLNKHKTLALIYV